MTHPLIAMNGISKSFGPVRVLEEVDLAIRAGEVVGLLGENGAGKSTLMNIVSGQYESDGGSLALDGTPFNPVSVAEGIAAGIRFVHQELSLAGSLSVAENLFLGDYLSNRSGFINRGEMTARSTGLLQSVGIGELDPSMAVGNLRAGEQQLLEIAKAVVTQPRLLILDEPTSSLTPVEAARLFTLVHDLAARGTSIIFITHRLEEALAHCDRIVVLRDGKLVGDELAADTTRDRLISHMVGRKSIFALRERTDTRSTKIRARITGLTDGDVLAPISLDVAEGEVLGLFGLLGSGRTEFLETLYGFRHMAAGTVEINGVKLRSASVHKSVAAGIALVPEGRKTRGILPTHSVRRNISASSLRQLSHAGAMRLGVEARQSDVLAEQLGIRMASPLQVITSLSGGNQQKAIFARALQSNPILLLLDEPTHGVDVGAKTDIYDIINTLADEGLSLVVASSELSEIMAIADRCAVFSGGELAVVLDRDDMNEESILQWAFSNHVSPELAAVQKPGEPDRAPP